MPSLLYTKHGLSRSRIHRIWADMKNRCNNPRAHNYSYYGERGICVCEQWCNSFLDFRDWALSNGYTEELTLDRKDNNGNYEPSNCRWTTMKVQCNNRRRRKDAKPTVY